MGQWEGKLGLLYTQSRGRNPDVLRIPQKHFKSSLSDSPKIPLPHLWMSMYTTGGFCAQREAESPAICQLRSLMTCSVLGIRMQLTGEIWASLWQKSCLGPPPGAF